MHNLCLKRIKKVPREKLEEYFQEIEDSGTRLLLLSNAVKFSEPGTEILIDASISEDNVYGQIIKIAITDTGIGIPAEELNTIFDKFIQSSKTRSEAGGTGLGLTISKQIVEDHFGRIQGKQNPVGGAIFSFVLPVVEDEYQY